MDLHLARRVSPAIAGAVAVGSIGVGTAWVLAVRDRLPDLLATHWGPAGAADGFQSLRAVLTTNAAIIATTALVTVLVTIPTRRPSATAVSSGTTVYLGFLLYGAALAQQGVADASRARLSNAMLAAGLVAGVLVGLGHAQLVRSKPGVAPYPRPAAPDRAPRARVDTSPLTWSGRLRHSATSTAVQSGAVAVLLVFAVWMWRVEGPWWLMLLLAALLAAMMAAAQQAGVFVDAGGVSVRALGRTLRRAELSQLKSASQVEVKWFSQYGGVGFRMGFDGSQGFITASGEALRLERFDAPALVLTVEGAARAAAVVNTLIDRQAAGER